MPAKSNFFGSKFLNSDGSVNRRKLGKVVFDDPRKLKILNNLIHPLVASEIEGMLRKIRGVFVLLKLFLLKRNILAAGLITDLPSCVN